MRVRNLFRNYQIAGSSLLVQSDVSFQTSQAQTKVVAPTYGVSVGIDCSLGDFFSIAVSNNTAFTITAPTNAPASGYGKLITITIANGSGGAMGAITWTAGAGGFRLAGAFTNPATANQRSILFRWSGLVWHEISRTAADVVTA